MPPTHAGHVGIEAPQSFSDTACAYGVASDTTPQAGASVQGAQHVR